MTAARGETMLRVTYPLIWLLTGCSDDGGAADAAVQTIDAAANSADAEGAFDAAGVSPDGPPLFACCSLDGATCTDVADERACTEASGYSFWPMMTCQTHTCTNEVQGACCLDLGDGVYECTDGTTVDACFGEHAGADTLCSETDCVRLLGL